jgi:TRAP-type C4-dicarboxylate transport system substrate-binding protein
MKRLWLVGLSLVLAAPVLLGAQRQVRIRLATEAPAGSLWEVHLKRLAADWRRISDNQVNLMVFAGGSAGDDAKVVSLLRTGRPEAAALTTGLARIDKAFNVFSLPFFYESNAELFAVVERLEPNLKQRLAQNGLTFVAWGFGGWVQIFSKEPVSTLDDLRHVKLWTSSSEGELLQWYKDNGFTPVPLSVADAMAALSTGRIDAMPSPPYAAMAFQWYNRAPHMLDLEVAPIVGAIVVNTRVWNQVPEAMRARLIDAAAQMDLALRSEIPEQDAEAVTEMRRRGLTVATRSGGGWTELSASLRQSMRGSMVPADVFDSALRARDTYRASDHQ